jgi:hypothetical protein
MAGSNSSVHGDRHDDDGIPVARAELHQMENSLLAAMERMFNERLPTTGGRDHVTSQFSSLLKEMQNNPLVTSPLSKSGIFSRQHSSCFSIKQE